MTPLVQITVFGMVHCSYKWKRVSVCQCCLLCFVWIACFRSRHSFSVGLGSGLEFGQSDILLFILLKHPGICWSHSNCRPSQSKRTIILSPPCCAFGLWFLCWCVVFCFCFFFHSFSPHIRLDFSLFCQSLCHHFRFCGLPLSMIVPMFLLFLCLQSSTSRWYQV